MHSGQGEYHGFLWFFFINEQLLRFLNLRYPRDYNTVPRLYFWLFHLIWLFPWSVYLPAVAKLSFRPLDRAGACACWPLLDRIRAGVLHLLHHPGVLLDALLSGVRVAAGLGDGDGRQLDQAWDDGAYRIAACSATAVIAILIAVRKVPTPGDIFSALSAHPGPTHYRWGTSRT